MNRRDFIKKGCLLCVVLSGLLTVTSDAGPFSKVGKKKDEPKKEERPDPPEWAEQKRKGAICLREGHVTAGQTVRISPGYPMKNMPLGCLRYLHSVQCARCGSEVSIKVSYSPQCPQGLPEDPAKC